MPRATEIERLYDEHAQPLYAFLLNFTRDEQDTRDLLQEIFIKLAREPRLLDGVREERAFLIRLARNAAIDLIRRRGTREKTKENFAAETIPIFAPANNPDEKVFREELSITLGELPEEQRAVVHLKLWDELTFEQKLQRQSLKEIPGEWRAEILSVADGAKISRHPSSVTRHWLSTLNHQLSTLLWPHPKAWAGLTAVWIFIFALNFSVRDKTPMIAEKVLPPSPEIVAELRQQKILFAELIGSSDAREAEPPKFFPRPRTERAEILTA